MREAMDRIATDVRRVTRPAARIRMAEVKGRILSGIAHRSWRRVRYRGLARNGAHLRLLCTATKRERAERVTACDRLTDGVCPSRGSRPIRVDVRVRLRASAALRKCLQKGRGWGHDGGRGSHIAGRAKWSAQAGYHGSLGKLRG